jgi:DNA repair protein RecO (recombination protein O)
MLSKTKGILLHSFKYGDTSLIAHIYTEQFGRQAYIVKGAYSKKASIKANIFYPLNLLEMEVYRKQNNNLQKLKEVWNNPIYTQIPFRPERNAIAVFIAEILYRTLLEEEANPILFGYLFNSLQILDLETKNIANFHIIFLIQLSKHLGFFPFNNFSETNLIFDLLNGRYEPETPMHGNYIHRDESVVFASMIAKGFNEIDTIILSRQLRHYLLEKLVEYYRLHISGMGNIKSLQILKEVFD